MKIRIVAASAFASVLALVACESNIAGCTVTLTAVKKPAFIRVSLQAQARPSTQLVVVSHYGRTTTQRLLITNARGIATTTYDLPRNRVLHSFSVTATQTQGTQNSSNSSTISTAISL